MLILTFWAHISWSHSWKQNSPVLLLHAPRTSSPFVPKTQWKSNHSLNYFSLSLSRGRVAQDCWLCGSSSSFWFGAHAAWASVTPIWNLLRSQYLQGTLNLLHTLTMTTPVSGVLQCVRLLLKIDIFCRKKGLKNHKPLKIKKLINTWRAHSLSASKMGD